MELLEGRAREVKIKYLPWSIRTEILKKIAETIRHFCHFQCEILETEELAKRMKRGESTIRKMRRDGEIIAIGSDERRVRYCYEVVCVWYGLIQRLQGDLRRSLVVEGDQLIYKGLGYDDGYSQFVWSIWNNLQWWANHNDNGWPILMSWVKGNDCSRRLSERRTEPRRLT